MASDNKLLTAFNATRSYHYLKPDDLKLQTIEFDLRNQWSYCSNCKAYIHKPEKPVCSVCNQFGLKHIKHPTFIILCSNTTFDTITSIAKLYPSTYVIIARRANQ